MRFFCQADVNNKPYENSLYRMREDADLIYEELWNASAQAWEPTTELTKLLVGGDCSTLEITKESAQSLIQSTQK
jgi:hypothetical protein